jgi:multimeric flavodoxin WrbA
VNWKNKKGTNVRVLAIIGSPRKGHSYRLTQRIERRLTKDLDVRFEYVFLSQMNLQACRGCYVCQSRGEQYCPLNDELAELVRRMQQADGVILVSPVYTGNVSGLMKSLMDRLAYTAHRPAFLGKPAMLVATGSSYTNGTLKALAWFGYTGFEIVSKLGFSVWPSPRRDWQGRDAADRKLEKAVRRFEKAISRRPGSLSLGKVLQFYVMKASAATDPRFFQADYDYHKTIDQLNFDVSGWKNALGHLCFWIALKWMERRLVPLNKGKDAPFES